MNAADYSAKLEAFELTMQKSEWDRKMATAQGLCVGFVRAGVSAYSRFVQKITDLNNSYLGYYIVHPKGLEGVIDHIRYVNGPRYLEAQARNTFLLLNNRLRRFYTEYRAWIPTLHIAFGMMAITMQGERKFVPFGRVYFSAERFPDVCEVTSQTPNLLYYVMPPYELHRFIEIQSEGVPF